MAQSYHLPAFLSKELPLCVTIRAILLNPCILYGLINFEAYLPFLNFAMRMWRRTQPPLKGSKRGRPGCDLLSMFKILFLEMVKGWSDFETESNCAFDMRYRQFVGCRKFPSFKTIWKYKNIFRRYHVLSKAMAFDIERFKAMLPLAGTKIVAIDSTLIKVPVRRNTRKENEIIRKGHGKWLWKGEENRNKRRQKDVDARWSKHNGKPRYGYAAHMLVCGAYKLVLACVVTGSNVHDSKGAVDLIKLLPSYPENIKPHGVIADGSPNFLGDSAYTSKKLHEAVEEKGWMPHTIIKTPKGGKLTEWEKEYNHLISQIRARVEHPFGMMKNACRGLLVRCKGIKAVTEEVCGRIWAFNLLRLVHFGA